MQTGDRMIDIKTHYINKATATHGTAKYINILWAIVGKLDYDILITEIFIKEINTEKITDWYLLVTWTASYSKNPN